MSLDDDAGLVRTLQGLVSDLFGWLGEHPSDEVDPRALAMIRQSVDGVVERAGESDAARLRAVVGVVVDVLWWLDTCEDDVDSDVAVGVLESAGGSIDGLSAGQQERLLEVLDQLATAETHNGRRYELRFFPFAMGLSEDEPDGEPAVRVWVHPDARQ